MKTSVIERRRGRDRARFRARRDPCSGAVVADRAPHAAASPSADCEAGPRSARTARSTCCWRKARRTGRTGRTGKACGSEGAQTSGEKKFKANDFAGALATTSKRRTRRRPRPKPSASSFRATTNSVTSSRP